MKPLFITGFLLVGLVSTRVIKQPAPSLESIAGLVSTLEVRDSLANLTHLSVHNSSLGAGPKPHKDDTESDDSDDEHQVRVFFDDQKRQKIWDDAVCRGENLYKAMLLDGDEAAALLQWPYIESRWDGDLRAELAQWGYSEDNEEGLLDGQCDLDRVQFIGTALRNLQVDTRSAGQRGSNRCYKIVHRDGPTVLRDPDGSLPRVHSQYYDVDGVIYRVYSAYFPPIQNSLLILHLKITDGLFKVGINARDGLISFLHRVSPAKAAEDTWDTSNIRSSELPQLRSSSDLAYGMWHRETTEENRASIKMFVALGIINKETWVIISRALGLGYPDDYYGTPEWPGRQFRFLFNSVNPLDEETEAALALLGSPNGLAVGYFLNQHKTQLGGTRFVWRITVFMGDDGMTGKPNILYEVDTGILTGPEHESSGKLKKSKAKKKKRRRNAQDSSESRRVVRTGSLGKQKSMDGFFKAEL
ncbi:hypothetical protein EJ07DRAFT_173638 [Lizonia empirigonia]|nr:hypothetical protein EJ07DRAFT_173638 [Lizonia empirigonia]